MAFLATHAFMGLVTIAGLYTPVMKDSEVRLFVALAAKHRLNLFKSDTKQAFMNGDMGDEKIYIRPLDWWQEKVPYGHALQLMKSMYGTRQAAGGETVTRAHLDVDGGPWLPRD
jgi:hypothetical protein